MQRRSFVQTVRSIVGTGVACLLGLRPSAAAAVPPSAPGGGMMGGGMMGGMMSRQDMQGMMSHDNMMGPMKLGMELFQRHAGIRRTTDHRPNGVIDTTISGDPTTAGIIQAHVVEMYRRLAENRPFPYPMSPSVTTMFANSTKYQRSYKLLADGIQVTETSDDPDMVKVIYAHARELDAFASDGMPAMMRGMMR